MKRFLTLLLALILLPGALPVLAEEASYLDEYAPYCRLEGDTLIVFEGVKTLGQYDSDWFYDEDEPKDETYLLSPEDAALFGHELIFANDYEADEFNKVQFPSSLIYLGRGSFYGYWFRELTLPASLRMLFPDAFYACRFDTLRIEADISEEQLRHGLDECRIMNFDVPEDHPSYKTVDGVLFSKDGKTLLRYPVGREEAHYDVPAGVERIGARAFAGAESLKTVSLPIGLKAVENYAFSGCVYLQSISLPLTVTEIGDCVFDYCVSLELVSLPEGLTANRMEEPAWVEYYADSALYRGDNGDTLTYDKRWEGVDQPSQLCRLARRGRPVPVYSSADAVNAADLLPPGMIIRTYEEKNGRISFNRPGLYAEPRWVEEKYTEYIPEDTLFYSWEVTGVPGVEAWKDELPLPGDLTPGIPLALKKLQFDHYDQEFWGYTRGELAGPFAVFTQNWRENGQDYEWQWFCRVQDADFQRASDDNDNEYGIVFNQDDPYGTIPLLDGPGGQEIKALHGGDQIQILAQEEGSYRVRVPLREGWIAGSHVKIIEEAKEEGEEE